MHKKTLSFAGVALAVLTACSTPPAKAPAYERLVAPAEMGIICRSDRVVAALKDQGDGVILVAAHRGAHLDAPENSLAAIRDAVEIGADIVELDVRLTRDGVPVLMHDASVDRTTNGAGAVATMTLAEIRALRLRGPDGALTEMQVPTLEEALAEGADRILINLDLKAEAVPAVVATVKAAEPAPAVMFYNSDLEVLSNIRALMPEAVVMPLAENAREAEFLAGEFDLEVIHLRPGYASARLAGALDRAGSANWLNALGEVDALLAAGSETAADSLIRVHPDALQTDQPQRLRAILAGQGLALPDLGETYAAPCQIAQP